MVFVLIMQAILQEEYAHVFTLHLHLLRELLNALSCRRLLRQCAREPSASVLSLLLLPCCSCLLHVVAPARFVVTLSPAFHARRLLLLCLLSLCLLPTYHFTFYHFAFYCTILC